MPFYEYECASCKFYTEVMQKISDAPLTKCPSCGKKALKKLVSAPNFRLKGAGWYETDFKSDQENKRNLAAADKDEAAAKPDSSTETDKPKAEPAADPAKETATKAPAPKPESKPAAAPSASATGRGSKTVRTAAKSVRRSTPARSAVKPRPAKGKKSAHRKKSRR
jgi:putative FmdB family regulatory protein